MSNWINNEDKKKLKEEIRIKRENIKKYLSDMPSSGGETPYFSSDWVKKRLLKKPK